MCGSIPPLSHMTLRSVQQQTGLCSLPYEIRDAHNILHDHWTMLQDTVQSNEPKLYGPGI
jgi:hypothetical protein